MSSEKTTFVWSLSLLIFTIGVTCNDVIGLSTNESFTESPSLKETTSVDDVISGKLLEFSANTCTLSDECQNGGTCVYEDGGNYCQCKNGTSGNHCEIVDECVNNLRKCGNQQDVQCIYNITKETAECKCSNASQGFDSYKKRCRGPCKSSKDCPEHSGCRKNLDSNLRFCRCPFRWGGDRCNEKVDECKAIGYDCGINPNVTCEEDQNKNPVCYCHPWSHGFNYQVKDCVECNCEGRNLGCKFSPEGEKTCYCETGYYQKDEKCLACDCGYGSSGCKSENGTKVCDCWGRYSQNDDKCEECDCGDNSHGCSFQNGTKTCSCKPGYIESNGTCRRICKESVSSDCTNGAKCKNSVCQCLPGTQGDQCEILDGCETLGKKYDKCGYYPDVVCAFNQTSGTSFCNCIEKHLRFDDYNKKCKECNCGTHGNCSFTFGNKMCKCEKGYEFNPAGRYGISQCSPCDCGPHSTGCRYEYHDSKVCTCSSGYAQRNDVCTDCSCGPNGNCSFDDYGKKVCNCNNGYADRSGNCIVCTCGAYGRCSFDDDGKKVCQCDSGYADRNGYCVPCSCGYAGECVWNEFGEQTCNCRDGYGIKDGECTKCSCWLDNAYSLKAGLLNCTFHDGKQKCTCPEGYKEITEGTCTDYSCGPDGKSSLNEDGEKVCKCNSGYGDKNGYCVQCSCQLDNGYTRVPSLICTFSNGNQICTCPEGYKEIPEGYCMDVNECEEPYVCPITTDCINTPGGYNCTCRKGYRPFSERHDTKLYDCIDINECLEYNECPYRDTTVCINTQGSYFCECKPGYKSRFSSVSIEYEGCQADQAGWKIGYTILIVVFCFVSFGLIIAICKRRSSSV